MTSSAEFSTLAKPLLYHLLSQPSRAALRSANSFAHVVFRLSASASFNSVSPTLASKSASLFSANALAFSDTAAFFSTVAAIFVSPCSQPPSHPSGPFHARHPWQAPSPAHRGCGSIEQPNKPTTMNTDTKIDKNRVRQTNIRLKKKQGIQNYRNSMPL